MIDDEYFREYKAKLAFDRKCRKIGEIISRFRPGTSLSCNCNGEWVIEIYDGDCWRVHVDPELAPAGLFKDPLDALLSIDKPVRKDCK